jgi:four helix bundle protein
MSDYKKLRVWKYAHKLVLQIYQTTKSFPEEEKYGIVSQIRRSASSIPTNIAEGCGQLDNSNLVRFLGIARGSAFELEYLILLSKDLDYLKKEEYSEFNEKIEQLIGMITNLIKSLNIKKLNHD